MRLLYIYISKWLKDQFKIPKEKIRWQYIDIKCKGHNINNTKININIEIKSYNTFISDTGDHNNNTIVSDNGNNNYNHNKNNCNKISNNRSRNK